MSDLHQAYEALCKEQAEAAYREDQAILASNGVGFICRQDKQIPHYKGHRYGEVRRLPTETAMLPRVS